MKRKYGLIPDPPDSQDYLYRATSPKLPKRVDMRDKMSPVTFQILGSCVSETSAGLKESMLGERTNTLSTHYHYWHTRALSGRQNEDSGVPIRDGMKVLQKIGICPIDLYPKDPARFRETPSEEADRLAKRNRVDAYYRIMQLAHLREVLAEGKPVVLGTAVYESFERASAGFIPMPNTQQEMKLGHHATLAVGYDDDLRVVIFKNSWGPLWGDKGYGYLPYEYFNTDLVHDMWYVVMEDKDPWDDITTQEAVDYIASRKFGSGEPVFDSPDFWHKLIRKYDGDETSDFRYNALAFRKIVAYMRERGV